MTVHHKYGGSTADRTMHCPAWIKLSKGIPQPPASEAAETGTAMHTMLELCMQDPDYEPDDSVGHKFNDTMVTQEMAEKVYTALEVVDDLAGEYKITFTPEVYHKISDDIGGTADLFSYSEKTDTMFVGDLKTGDGVQVYAKENAQLMFYAWLMVNKFSKQLKLGDNTRVVLFIVQPSYNREDPLDKWETTLPDILRFGQQFMQAIKMAESGLAIAKAGKWCKFCRAMTVCPAKNGQIQAAMRIDPQHEASLNDAMAIVDDVEEWVREVRKFAHEQAEQGVQINGWKLVQKRATRQWVSDIMAEEQLDELGVDKYTYKLVSPAQAEKICKKKDIDFSKLSVNIESVSSGTTLAHADDKRPAVMPLQALAAMARNVKA